MSDTDTNKRIARNTLFLYIRMAVVMLLTLYTVRVVLNSLGVEDYGVYNVVCGFVSMFAVFNTTLSSGTSRFYNFELGKGDNGNILVVFNTSIRIQIVLSVLLFVLIEVIGVWYLNTKMIIPYDRMAVANWIFQFAIGSLLLVVLQTPFSAAILSYERMDFMAVVSILDACLKLGIAIFVKFANCDKLWIYGFLMLFVSVLNIMIYIVYVHSHLPHLRFKKKVDMSMVKPMLTFSGWMLLDPVAYAIKGQGSNLVLNYFFGPIMNAAYAVSNQVMQALESFSGNISVAFRPQIVQSYSSGNFSRTKNLFNVMSKIMFALKLMICVPVVFESKFLLDLWLGSGSYPNIAVPFSQILVATACVNSFAHPITVVVTAVGHIRKYMMITSSIVSSCVVISFVCLVFHAPATIVYWSMALVSIVNLVASLMIVEKVFPSINFSDYFRQVLFPSCVHAVIVVIAVFCSYHLCNIPFVRVILVVLSSFLASLVGTYFCLLGSKEKYLIQIYMHNVFSRIKNSR